MTPLRSKAGLALMLCTVLLCGITACETDTTNSAYFEQAWKDFDENYSYFTYKNIDWDAVKQQYGPSFQQSMTADQFAEKLNDMLQVLHDWHVEVYKPSGEGFGYQGSYIETGPSKPRNKYVLGDGYQTLGEVIWYGKVGVDGNENIGHVRIDSFSSEYYTSISDQDIEGIFAALADTDGLIIDIRRNSGGAEEIAHKFMARFTNEPRLYGYTKDRIPGTDHNAFGDLNEHVLEPGSAPYYGKPVAGLIGPKCMSSAEWCTLMMRACPTITLIGEKTRGASGNPKVLSLPNSVSYKISIWIAYTDQMVEIEDKGIEPHIKIAAEQSLDENADYVMEKAISFIKEGGTRPSGTTTTTPAGSTSTSTAPSNTTTSIAGGGTTSIPGTGTTTSAPATTSIPGGTTTSTPATTTASGATPSLAVDPTSGQAYVTLFTFTAQPGALAGRVTEYWWDFDGDGAPIQWYGGANIDYITETNTVSDVEYYYAGTYTAYVIMFDDEDNYEIASATVTVTN